jgi:hypothetical protein
MGGMIVVKSKVGYGTTFSFTLPLHFDSDNYDETVLVLKEQFEQSLLTKRTIQVNEELYRATNSVIEESKGDFNSEQAEQMSMVNIEESKSAMKKWKTFKNERKSSSKDFYEESKQKLGDFEMVFNQAEKSETNPYLKVIDSISTPKLSHSSTPEENSMSNQILSHQSYSSFIIKK